VALSQGRIPYSRTWAKSVIFTICWNRVRRLGSVDMQCCRLRMSSWKTKPLIVWEKLIFLLPFDADDCLSIHARFQGLYLLLRPSVRAKAYISTPPARSLCFSILSPLTPDLLLPLHRNPITGFPAIQCTSPKHQSCT
jgi:hypothetical protein